ncbi:MAG: tail fiber protein [Bdellovibrionales bacterium]|jgi:microcystin-dependent protein|nr:tail fiber protein [Bdellovibrionales bacterium]
MKKLISIVFALSAISTSFASDCMLGEMKMFAGNFAPRNWAFADGQLLSINQNSALFSILGTTYGGDGRTTFALPDMRGRVAIHEGRGPGLAEKRLGQKSGRENVNVNNILPIKTQTIDVNQKGNTTPINLLVPYNNRNGSLNNMQPYTTVNYIICLQGIYPSRS